MKSPFKFLDSYTKDDREIFFGRDSEIEELYQRVFDSKLLLVYGISGTGKSSLIHCGLANKFRETDWLPLVIRRGWNIIESMAAVIKAALITPLTCKFTNPADFKKGVRSLYLDHYKPVFFIFDQFEELFIFGDKEERRVFIQIVKSLIESDLQCRLIFVIREEYMAGVTEFEKYVPAFFANRVRIEKMSHVNALEAIKEPCRVFNISVEDGFAESLLEKLSPGSADVELTYLQVFLDKIFRIAKVEMESQKDIVQLSFTLTLLNKVGNVSDLLGSFLDDQIALLDDPDDALVVLKAFVSGKGTKRPASESETVENVNSIGKEIPAAKVMKLIQTFVRLRVLRDKDDNGRYELRHDALAEKVYEKFTLAEKELLELRQFIENAYQYYLKRKVLLNNDDLQFISNKDSLINLNSDLQNFLQESRKHIQAKIRTVRRLTVISAFVFVLLIVILAYYVSSKLDVVAANNNAVKSLSQTKNLKDKLSFAALAWEKSHGVLPKEALLKAFNNYLYYDAQDSATITNLLKYKLSFEPAPVEIQYAKCSNDNKYIFGYGDSLILIWETTGKLYRTIRSNHPVIDIKMSDDSKFIGAVTNDSLLTVWDILGNSLFSYRIRYNILNTKQIFKFIPGENIISLSSEHDAVIVNSEGKICQTFNQHIGRVNAVDVSNDNNFIATASSDKTIIIWYFNSIKKEYDYYNTLTWHRDTVWSVSFSKFRISVLSTSNDSTVITGSINNEVSDNATFPNDKQYCYAEFSRTNRGLIAECYDYKNKEFNKNYIVSHVDNPTYNPWRENKTLVLIHGVDGFRFHSFVFSSDEQYFIYLQNNKTYLADTKLVYDSDRSSISNLMELDGSNHFFTADSKYIIAIEGNTFRTYFIDTEDIFKSCEGQIE
jgi:WD40 repeat protein